MQAVIAYIFGILRGCFQFFPLRRYFGPQYQPLSTSDNFTGPTVPLYQHEARRFLQRFNLKYGANHPAFFVGEGGNSSSSSSGAAQDATPASSTPANNNRSSIAYESVFDEVMDKAKQEYKIVLVYLHSDQHQNTPNFCQNVLCTDTFKDYVDANFLFYAADTCTSDGYLLSNLLGATTYPFISVLINLNSTKYEIMYKSEGDNTMNVDALVTKLIEVHENTMPRLIVQRDDDNELVQRRLQREEQDRAYQAAIDQDRKRQEEEQRKIEEARKAAELAEQKKLEKIRAIEKIAADRKRLKQQTPAEPVEKSVTCTVRFRFPDGSQAQRKFHKNDKVQVLYEFVHTMNLEDESGEASLVAEPMSPKTPSTPLNNSKWKPHMCSDIHHYELVLSYPKIVLDREKTLEESQCYPQATIFVREESDHLADEEIQPAN